MAFTVQSVLRCYKQDELVVSQWSGVSQPVGELVSE
jgi:hypothetical protein